MADVIAELQSLDDHLRLSGGSVAQLLAHHAVQAHGLPQWTAAATTRATRPADPPIHQTGTVQQGGTITHSGTTTLDAPKADIKADTKADMKK